MYWLKVIWAIYIVVLSFVPCSDAMNRCEPGSISLSASVSTEHDHQDDSDDNCSPFCHCACCSISIAVPDMKVLPRFTQAIIPFASKKVAIADPFLISAYFGNIWQPPRFIA